MGFAPLVDYLISVYTWRGAMLVMSGIFMNYFVVGALMRPPNMIVEEVTEEKEGEKDGASAGEKMKLMMKSDEEFIVGSVKMNEMKSKHLLLKEQIAANEKKTASSSVRNINRASDAIKSTLSLRSNLHIKNSFRDLLDVPNCHLSSQSLNRNNSASFMSQHSMNRYDSAKLKNTHITSNETKLNESKDYNKMELAKYASSNPEPKPLRWYTNLNYLAYILNLFAVGIGISCVYVHFPAYVMVLGTSSERASLLVSIMGFGSILGRLAIGMLTNM